MRRLAILAFVLLLLIVGGGLTAQIASEGGTFQVPAVIRTTNNPDASVLDMTPWKAEQLFLVIGFILFNLIGAAVTVAVVFWLLHRQVKRVKAEGGGQPARTSATNET
ncbi:MAG: hypothetical protein HZC41_01280 [Chloroflexi bacterium]|nr:hypothetical protein [Chloroflexota bacterium]